MVAAKPPAPKIDFDLVPLSFLYRCSSSVLFCSSVHFHSFVQKRLSFEIYGSVFANETLLFRVCRGNVTQHWREVGKVCMRWKWADESLVKVLYINCFLPEAWENYPNMLIDHFSCKQVISPLLQALSHVMSNWQIKHAWLWKSHGNMSGGMDSWIKVTSLFCGPLNSLTDLRFKGK